MKWTPSFVLEKGPQIDLKNDNDDSKSLLLTGAIAREDELFMVLEINLCFVVIYYNKL